MNSVGNLPFKREVLLKIDFNTDTQGIQTREIACTENNIPRKSHTQNFFLLINK